MTIPAYRWKQIAKGTWLFLALVVLCQCTIGAPEWLAVLAWLGVGLAIAYGILNRPKNDPIKSAAIVCGFIVVCGFYESAPAFHGLRSMIKQPNWDALEEMLFSRSSLAFAAIYFGMVSMLYSARVDELNKIIKGHEHFQGHLKPNLPSFSVKKDGE